MSESVSSAVAGVGTGRDQTRARIVTAAANLLAAGGRDAVTTRAVAEAASVQPPTIYRFFGDMAGLLEAVAEHGFTTYLQSKRVQEFGPDPVEDLRNGWDVHVAFGLTNPALYALMYGDPHPGVMPAAAAAAERMLKVHIRRVAAAGRLRAGEDQAAHVVHAFACGTVLTLLAMPEDRRDPGLSQVAREAAIAAITTESSVLESPGPAAAAVALRAVLQDATDLSDAERRLLDEWLNRLTMSRPGDPPS